MEEKKSQGQPCKDQVLGKRFTRHTGHTKLRAKEWEAGA